MVALSSLVTNFLKPSGTNRAFDLQQSRHVVVRHWRLIVQIAYAANATNASILGFSAADMGLKKPLLGVPGSEENEEDDRRIKRAL